MSNSTGRIYESTDQMPWIHTWFNSIINGNILNRPEIPPIFIYKFELVLEELEIKTRHLRVLN